MAKIDTLIQAFSSVLAAISYRIRRLRWNHLVPLVTILFGYTSCAICGGDTRLDGTNVCLDFNIKTITGLPYGPVKVTWDKTDQIDQYMIRVFSNYGEMGWASVDRSQNSATLTINKAIADKTIAGDGVFSISGYASLSLGNGVGECISDKTWTYQKKAKKAAPPATAVPQPTQPPQQQPPLPAPPKPKPTATVFIPIIIIPKCPANTTGTYPNCFPIPR